MANPLPRRARRNAQNAIMGPIHSKGAPEVVPPFAKSAVQVHTPPLKAAARVSDAPVGNTLLLQGPLQCLHVFYAKQAPTGGTQMGVILRIVTIVYSPHIPRHWGLYSAPFVMKESTLRPRVPQHLKHA